MKKITFFLFVCIALWSCAGKDMEMSEAKRTAETAMNLISNEDYDKLSELYSTDFNNSESKEVRIQKFKQIIEATGSVQDFKLIDSSSVNEIGEESRITLSYHVQHSKISTFETYKIGLESGKYVIAGIDIQMSE